MAIVSSRARAEHARQQWGEQEASPERTKVWTEPKPRPRPRPAKAAVVYYLSRNGHLEQPHFMEVTVSSPDGLYLRDVISRLNALRGKGMARLYSWSSKRSYKNGFVWHDLADDDYIHPVHGHEYVLKGTELLLAPLLGTASSSSTGSQIETPSSSSSSEMGKPAREDGDFVAAQRRRKKALAWSPLDLGEYKVYKSEENAASAADAATQTDDHRRRRRMQVQEELGREDISPPPPSSSSPETLEAVIKSDGRIVPVGVGVGGCSGGRTRASAMLMQLISCGSISVKGGNSLPVMAQYRARLARAAAADAEMVQVSDGVSGMPSFRRKVVEEKQYFSGSLVETKMSAAEAAGEFSALRRSSSYNADRALKMELPKEIDDSHDRCIPRKPKTKKESYLPASRSTHGSKRFGD